MSGLRGRSAVTAGHRSALPRVPGIPWWAATIVAALFAAIGFAYDASTGSQTLGTVFTTCYVLGCVVAVVAVRQSGLFTAVIQPPLILFIAVPSAYFVFHGSTFTGIKDTLINCGYPLIERFPLMFFTSATVLLIGMARWFLSAAGRRATGRDAEPVAVAVPADGLLSAAEPSTLAATASAPRRSRRSTAERPSRATAKATAKGTAKAAAVAGKEAPIADEAPAARPPRRAAAASRGAPGAAAGSTRSRHSRPPETEIADPTPGRPRRRNTPPVDSPAEPRRRPRSGDPREAREPRDPRAPRERRPLPPLDRRTAADRPERADRPQRRERPDPFESRPARSERPQRRPRAADYDTYDYEPYDAPEPPPSRAGGSNGTHHPVSRVRYRGSDDGEQRTEHRTRPRRARHSAPESWEYDA